MRVCSYQAFAIEANILESQKIPSASFGKTTVQSSLNRIRFIAVFPPRQYKRGRSQYFDNFQSCHFVIIKQIFMRLEVCLQLDFCTVLSHLQVLALALRTCVHSLFEFFA